MSKPIQPNIPGFKVRIQIGSSTIHAFSTTEPVISINPESNRISSLEITQNPDANYGDFIAFADWSAVNLVAWKKTDEPKPKRPPGRPKKITSTPPEQTLLR